MKRTHYDSGTQWEPLVGYSRAVRVGPTIHVSGTTAVDDQGQVLAPGDCYGQAVHILAKIETALKALGADLKDVVRTRMYVTDIEHWSDIGRAHREVFGDIRPATSLVEVSRLISPEILVEIEVDAISGKSSGE
ncbi:MAG: RidA family protein [Planctomycetota bacterium]